MTVGSRTFPVLFFIFITGTLAYADQEMKVRQVPVDTSIVDSPDSIRSQKEFGGLLSKGYFVEVVGDRSPMDFADTFVTRMRSLSAKNDESLRTSKVLRTTRATYLVHYSGDPAISNRELVGRSDIPHIWLKYSRAGDVVQVGASLLSLPDSNEDKATTASAHAQHVVFFFTGKHKGQALLESW